MNPSNNLAQMTPRAGWRQLAAHAQALHASLARGGHADWAASTLGRAVAAFSAQQAGSAASG